MNDAVVTSTDLTRSRTVALIQRIAPSTSNQTTADSIPITNAISPRITLNRPRFYAASFWGGPVGFFV